MPGSGSKLCFRFHKNREGRIISLSNIYVLPGTARGLCLLNTVQLLDVNTIHRYLYLCMLVRVKVWVCYVIYIYIHLNLFQSCYLSFYYLLFSPHNELEDFHKYESMYNLNKNIYLNGQVMLEHFMNFFYINKYNN